MKKLLRAIPHLTLILALMTLLFFIIDRFNTGMAFMTSELSKWLFATLALTAAVSSVALIALNWETDDAIEEQEALEEEAKQFAERVRYAEMLAPKSPFAKDDGQEEQDERQ